MTLQEDVRIGEALVRLAVARGGEMDDLMSEVYTTGLADLPADLVAEACASLGREPRAAYSSVMPALADIRDRVNTLMASHNREALLRSLPPTPEADQRTWVYCTDCRDTSWFEHWCRGVPVRPLEPLRWLSPVKECMRHYAHEAHTYTERCACADRNPVLIRQRTKDTRVHTPPR